MASPQPRRRRWRPGGPNAVVLLWTEPAWSLAAAWQTSYLTVYLVARGLRPTAVGVAVGIGALVQVAGLLAAGWMADHLGRKTVIMAGDFIGWIVAYGLWALARSPAALALGLVLINGFAFVTPAWNSLFAEDVEPSRVSFYYLILQQLTLAGGLLIPLLSPVVHRLGVVGSGHWAILVSWPLIGLAWLLRLLWLRESSVGHAQRAARREGRHAPLRQRLAAGWRGGNRVLAALRVLLAVTLTLWATFAPLVLVSRRAEALAPQFLAFLPLASTVAGVGVLVTARRWRTTTAANGLGGALILMAAGMAGVALAPRGWVLLVLVAWAFVAAGQAMFWTVHTTLWMAALPDAARVDVQGWVGALSAVLVAVAAPTLARWLPMAPRSAVLVWVGAVTVALALVAVQGHRLEHLPPGRES
jgi:MFS family permease